MTLFLLRGAHANEYELQNYYPLARKLDIKVITTSRTLTPISLPTIRLWSPADLPNFPYKKQIFNRLIGGDQWLLGLESLITKQSNSSNHRTIVHTAETYTPYTHQAVELRKKRLIDKLICTCWETIPHNNEKLTKLRRWKQEAYEYVDLFHTPTKRAKVALVQEGVDPKKIMVIPYGVDLKKFSFPECKLHKRPVILTVARLVLEKGMEDIDQVASFLPQYDFLVVGEGDYAFRSPNVTVKSVSYSRMPSIYQQADLFFFPSRTTSTWEEQYGMALVEAMASGLPIVASSSGAIPEVAGSAAILVDPHHIESYVSAINQLINNEAIYKKLSKNGHVRALKLSQQSSKLKNLY